MISIIKHVTLVVSEKHGKQRNRLNQLDEDLWSCRGTNLRDLFHPRIMLRGVFVNDMTLASRSRIVDTREKRTSSYIADTNGIKRIYCWFCRNAIF